MTGWEWLLLYVCAGAGVAEGMRANRKTQGKNDWTVSAWIITAVFWWFWILLWTWFVIMILTRGVKR